MNLTIRTKAIIAAFTLMIASVFVAAPAQAQALSAPAQIQAELQQVRSLDDCPNSPHAVCAWKTTNFTGSVYYWTLTGMSDGQCTNTAGTWDNSIKGVGTTGYLHEIRFYTGANCTNSYVTYITADVVAYEKATCLNNYSPWVTSASSCATPKISSFKVWDL